jgi:hypothetical protein
MLRAFKWLAIATLVAAFLLIGGAFALQQWLRTDDFRSRVEREASAAIGVPLKLGRLSIDLWPLPAVAAEQVQVQTRPPLTLERVELRPVWSGLLAGRVDIATLVVRKAVLPQAAIAAIGAGMQKKTPGAAAPAPARGPAVGLPRTAVLDDVTWVDEKGQRMTVDARVTLADDGWLDAASVQVLQGRFAGAKAKVDRQGATWPVRVDIGGGRIAGKMQLLAGKGGSHQLQGQLTTENVEVAALTAPSRTLTGKLQAQTTLRAEFREIAQLADVLQTQTKFTVHDAVLQGIDLAKAVETVGLSRGGLTRLDTLAGNVATQGKAVHLTNLVATSGALAANGNVSMAPNRSLSGRITVDLSTVKGAVGVPLAVGGTVDSPTVMLTRGALIGAAVGTVIAPGIGTGAGASTGDKVGDKLRRLFGK